MSLRAMTWAFDQPLSGNEKVVLLALADNANDQGICWPGQRYVAEKACITERTVRAIMVKLEDRGYLGRRPRYRANGSRSSDLIALRMAPEDISGGTGRRFPGAPEDAFRGHRKTLSGPEPSIEPSTESESPDGDSSNAPANQFEMRVQEAPEPRRYRARVKVEGRAVPPLVVDRAVEALGCFNEVFGRSLSAWRGDGMPSGHLSSVAARLVESPDVSVDDVRAALENVRRCPPDWVTEKGRRVELGDVFGPRAFYRALENDGSAPRPPGGDAERERLLRIEESGKELCF